MGKSLKDWFFVTFDDESIYIKVSAPEQEKWQISLEWNDIIRIFFKAEEEILFSDEIYIFTNQRQESYVIPTQAHGGSELWGEIIDRGLFDAELAINAAIEGNGLYCWPEE